MFSKLVEFFGNAVRRAPLLYDVVLAAAIVPICAVVAYQNREPASKVRDWQHDRLVKREAYSLAEENPKREATRLRYKEQAAKLGRLVEQMKALLTAKGTKEEAKKVAAEIDKVLAKLNSLHTELIYCDPEDRQEILAEGFMEEFMNLVGIGKVIEGLKLDTSLAFLRLFEESAAHLLLTLSIDKSPIYEKYAIRISEQMQSWRNQKPYCLKTALAESYFHNLSGKPGPVYDGRVVPMNPERMENYDCDIVFVHGQQSHCFNSWRTLQLGDAPGANSSRSCHTSTLWPPKFLGSRYASRLLALNYSTSQMRMGRSALGAKNSSITEIADDLIEGMINSQVGQKPTIVVTHSMGALVWKRILERASKGDPRLQPLLHNLKGVVFISGPHMGVSVMDNVLRDLRNSTCLMLRFDPMGELAIPVDEAIEYMFTTSYHSKSSYYLEKKEKKGFEKLQDSFDKLKIDALCITEGKKCKFGPMGTPMLVVTPEEAAMPGYKCVHIEEKNHSEINKVADEKDPTFVAIDGYIREKLAPSIQ